MTRFSTLASLAALALVGFAAADNSNSNSNSNSNNNGNSKSNNNNNNNKNNNNNGNSNSNSIVIESSGSSSEAITIEQSSSGSDVIIIWVNGGGSSATSTVATPPQATSGTTHQVTVGGDAGLVYSPDTITAAVGDMVEFTFLSENHTATQSSFTAPCVRDTTGIDSGFMPNPNNTVGPPPKLAFQVQTTTPVWMYCRQTGHCGKGMVFSINPTANKTQSDFKNLAIQLNGTSTDSSSGSSTSSSSGSSTSSSSGSSASVAAGTAGTDSSGQCSCSCLCGVTDFPSGAGANAVGGMSGAISISEVGTLGRRALPPMIAAS